MILYTLSYTNPLTHFLDITIKIEHNKQEELYLQLPAWRPGRYELQHFAQKLRNIKATGNRESLTIQKVTKDRWVVQAAKADTVEISYSFYARQMDGGGSWLDEEQLYINPINCLMAVEGKENENCLMKLKIPEDWTVACGLPEKQKHVLEAKNYDELVDSPFIASDSLKHETYEVNGILFHIWIQGQCSPDWNKIKKDFKAFTIEQLKVFGDFPVTEYHYLNEILPYRFYHGVEHSNSTVITLGPSELLMNPSLYKEFLGVSSHELFHTWNVKKIRPKEMLPYNFKQENYFKTGYVAEGITTYYGDYMLARAGVFTVEQYFEELNTTLQRYFNDYSRNNLSIADSSYDLWLDGYKPGIPDRKVSIYIKGALTALLLDLQLRKLTQNQKSLDDVMKALWERFGKVDIGYTEEDYAVLVSEIAGTPFNDYFDKYIDGTAPIEPALKEALQHVGCKLVETPNQLIHESRYGFKVNATNGVTKVTAIAPDSPASNTLSIDDELIALNGRKVDNNLQQLLTNTSEKIELTLFRNYQLKTVSLASSDANYYSKYTIERNPKASEEQVASFNLWLGSE